MIRPLTASVMLAALLVIAAPAQAETFCIGTVAELRQALAMAENNGQDDWLQLRAGRYELDRPLVHHTRDGRQVTIDGGYVQDGNGDCRQTHVDPTRTVIDGNHVTPIIAFSNSGTSLGFTFRWLSLRNGIADDQRNPVWLRGDNTSTGSIQFYGVRIEGMTGDPIGHHIAVDIDVGAGNLRIANTVFAGNLSGASNAPAIRLRVDGQTRTYIRHNTFAENHVYLPVTARGIPQINALELAGGGSWELDNNIIDFTGVPLQVNARMRLRHNLVTDLEGDLAPGSEDNRDAPPQFVSFDDLRLRGDSPAIDDGRGDPVGGTGTHDAWGQRRVVGSAPDIGAYEYPGDALFGDGFETPESL